MADVYIFGAGASRAYGQSPSGVFPPLARDFFKTYGNLPIAGDFEVRVGDIVNYVKDVFAVQPGRFGEFNQDIEQFMTQLDLQLRYLAGQVAEGDATPEVFANFVQSNKAYDQMIFLIAHVLNEIQNGPVSVEYRAIATNCRPSDTLITFNWDTLLDRAMYETGVWSPDTGYAVLFESILEKTWRPPTATKTQEPLLLKLHGSTNWLVNYMTRHLTHGDRGMVTRNQREGYKAVIFDAKFKQIEDQLESSPEIRIGTWGMSPPPEPSHPDALPLCLVDASQHYPSYNDRYRPGYAAFSYFFPPNHPRTEVPLMPLVVAPTSFKLYDEFSHVLDPLWKYAEQALAQAQTVVIVGYSFPDTDIRALNLLRNSFATHTPSKIEVINPQPTSICHRLIRDVGLPQEIIHPVAQGFHEYISSRESKNSEGL